MFVCLCIQMMDKNPVYVFVSFHIYSCYNSAAMRGHIRKDPINTNFMARFSKIFKIRFHNSVLIVEGTLPLYACYYSSYIAYILKNSSQQALRNAENAVNKAFLPVSGFGVLTK